MSIADEIQNLNTNLQAAKSAVTAKGGTVGDTGLTGLAEEIASIPTLGNIKNADIISARTLSGTVEADNFVYIQERTYSQEFTSPLTPKSGYAYSTVSVPVVYRISSNEFVCIVQYAYGASEVLANLNYSASMIRVSTSSGTPLWGTEVQLGNYYVNPRHIQGNDLAATQHPIVLCTMQGGLVQSVQVKVIRCTSGGTPSISSSSYDYKKYSDYTSMPNQPRVTQLSETNFIVTFSGYIADSGQPPIGGTNYVEFLAYTMSTSEASATAGPTNRTSLGTALGSTTVGTIFPLSSTQIVYLGGYKLASSQNAFKVVWSGSSISVTQLTSSISEMVDFSHIAEYSSSGDNHKFVISFGSTLYLISITSSSISILDSVSSPGQIADIFIESGRCRTTLELVTETFTISDDQIVEEDSVASYEMSVRVSDTEYWYFGPTVYKINPQQEFNYVSMPSSSSLELVNGLSLKNITSENTSNAVAKVKLS